MIDSNAELAAQLRTVANWLTLHPELPTPDVTAYPRLGLINLSWEVDTDEKGDSLHALTAHMRSDHRYDDKPWTRIVTGDTIEGITLRATVCKAVIAS